MVKIDFFKNVDDVKSVVKPGSAVAYYADHNHFRHMIQLFNSYIGKTTAGFDLVPIRNFRELRALDRYQHIYIIPSIQLMPMIALNINEANSSLLIDLTGFTTIPAVLPKYLTIHKCDLKALLAQRPTVKFVVDAQSIQAFEFTRDLSPENVLAFTSTNQAKAILSNPETILVATFDKSINREMYSLLFRQKENVEMIVVPRTTQNTDEINVSVSNDLPSDLF